MKRLRYGFILSFSFLHVAVLLLCGTVYVAIGGALGALFAFMTFAGCSCIAATDPWYANMWQIVRTPRDQSLHLQ